MSTLLGLPLRAGERRRAGRLRERLQLVGGRPTSQLR
ncbi:MAG: hypothetical protein JWN32_828, partial [Solirubrobacterales bacterium]|nr:hypothetical protein [Solirubrobacterales bacterium]